MMEDVLGGVLLMGNEAAKGIRKERGDGMKSRGWGKGLEKDDELDDIVEEEIGGEEKFVWRAQGPMTSCARTS